MTDRDGLPVRQPAPVACANRHCDRGASVPVRGEFCRSCRQQQAATRQSIHDAKVAQWNDRRAVERETGLQILDDGTVGPRGAGR